MTFWVAGAAVVGAVGGALITGNAAKDASQTQANASQTAIGEQQREFDTNQANFAPYLAAGTTALGQIQSGLNAPVDPTQDPGYQFGLSQGQKALASQTAANGGRDSGAALKAADEFATNYATTGYSAAYQRGQDRLNRLSALAGLGQTAAGGSGVLGQQATTNLTGLTTAQGNAAAAGQLAQGNIWANGTNALVAAGQKYAASPSYGTPSSSGYGMPVVSGYAPSQNYGPD